MLLTLLKINYGLLGVLPFLLLENCETDSMAGCSVVWIVSGSHSHSLRCILNESGLFSLMICI
jgi:hypothetical protein